MMAITAVTLFLLACCVCALLWIVAEATEGE